MRGHVDLETYRRFARPLYDESMIQAIKHRYFITCDGPARGAVPFTIRAEAL